MTTAEDDKGTQPPSTPDDDVPIAELTREAEAYAKAAAMRLILAGLDDDDAQGRAGVFRELRKIADEDREAIFTVIGYVIGTFVGVVRIGGATTIVRDVVLDTLGDAIVFEEKT
jgi:hypothetical protein